MFSISPETPVDNDLNKLLAASVLPSFLISAVVVRPFDSKVT
jgi:hypothetical protein